ncbi:MAG: 5'/3'-nucleotidase SurE [Thermodesulfovibrionales bacterium]|nr:5'/3'-nucleotidase SurE [Thermodesulfovibrionales bacterium]
MALILLTNDDGIHAHGIKALYHAFLEIAEVYIVAPDRERSASSHSLTLHRPLKVSELGDRIFSVNGTPTDCVALAVNKILPKKPELIISGINDGPNLGDDITYSGTVSAAIEGTILGIPSFAISLDTWIMKKNHKEGFCETGVCWFESATRIALIVARFILEHSLPYDTLLNVNVPNLPLNEIKGIKLTRQGKRIYDNAIQEVYSPSGEKHYWIGGGEPYWERGEDTDINAVVNGYVSITPVHLDLTNYEALKYLSARWQEIEDQIKGFKEVL